MKRPKRIDMTPDELGALLERVQNSSIQDGDYELIKAMAETIELVRQASDEKAASIKRLMQLLFGDDPPKGHGRK